MTFHPVFKEFLSTFASRRVRFLIVGGHALAVHGRPRYTDDLDVWVEPTAANARRVIAALSDFGYPSYRLAAEEFTTPDRMTHLGQPPLRIDIMTSITGVSFREAWARRVPAKIEGMTLSFLGRDQLIANKAASARPKDLADLALLAELEPARPAPGKAATPPARKARKRSGKPARR